MRSWEDTICRERRNIKTFLEESPSLKAQLNLVIADAYEDAVYQAESETRLSLSTFPEKCPWSFAEAVGEAK